ncbi:MAG TPA: methyltransferase domain-containing protein [Symbiobacteriaceae bacterium]|nr:methyltransferase domain-containing protein [Symbiobacteriaceae bacterium]
MNFDPVAREYDFAGALLQDHSFFLRNLSQGRRRALDVGCGSGLLTSALAPHYGEVVGIDISQEMLALARATRGAPNITYLEMDAHHPALGQPFDLIVSRTTLHHLADLPAVLEAWKALLAPGGRLVLLDNVSERPTPPTWSYVAGALLAFPGRARRFGLSTAVRLFRHETSRPWLAHLASDRYLSEAGFRELYGGALPGCQFHRLGCFMGVVWDLCQPPRTSRSAVSDGENR